MAQEYIEQLFLQEKPTLALLAIEDCVSTYTAEIAKIIDSTFAHTTNIVSKFKEYGIVEFHQSGRKKEVRLTAYGLRIAQMLKEFIQMMESDQKSLDVGIKLNITDVEVNGNGNDNYNDSADEVDL